MPDETTIQVPDTVLTGGVTVTAIEQDNYRKSVYYFDVVTEHSITIQNQITDNYVENNTAIHDHIAHSPITVTVRGISGEKVFTPSAEKLNELLLLDNAKNQTEVSTAGKLLALTFLYPPVCNTAQVAINAWEYVKSSYNRYAGIVKSFSNSNNPLNSYLGVTSTYTETRLEEIYARLFAKRENNSEFTVETPYKTFDNMYIQSLTLRQGEENYVTDIEITFKQLNFADVTTTNPDESVMEQYNENAKAATENCGTADGVSRDTGALCNILLK